MIVFFHEITGREKRLALIFEQAAFRVRYAITEPPTRPKAHGRLSHLLPCFYRRQ